MKVISILHEWRVCKIYEIEKLNDTNKKNQLNSKDTRGSERKNPRQSDILYRN